jgi:hypothetical protein
MAMVLIALNVCLMLVTCILNFFSRVSIEGVWVVPLAPAVITMSGSIFHPNAAMSFIRG